MENTRPNNPPYRITDLVTLKKQGMRVTCCPSFEVIPVDFTHRDYSFQAHIFLCRYNGTVGDRNYSFRKCYARGCPHNLCPHVSQAVMIANRYLQRDYRKLKSAGIEVEDRYFSLEDMVVKFDDIQEIYDPILTIHDYINIALEGNVVTMDVFLKYVPAVEHFAHHKNSQIFLMGDFSVTTLGRTQHYQRCFACYPTEAAGEQKDRQIKVANERLNLLYQEFDQASVDYAKRFFE